MKIYQVRLARNGKMSKPRISRWGLNSKKDHTGNICLDPLTHDIYFTRCLIDDPDLKCEIWWARKLKRGWEEPQRLRGEVNLKEYTVTQPAIGRLKDSTLILYFSSNRPGGMGGMDLWYSIIKNDRATEPVNLGPQINTSADDITPFYDQVNNVLYFSSDRAGGKGGHDIYCATGARNSWQKAEPVCGCLNSEQNDVYFTITEYLNGSNIPSSGYLSSNRSDSYYLTDSLCCNDLYRWTLDSNLLADRRDSLPDTLTMDTTQLSPLTPHHFTFPLLLYFHNDEPDPRSRESVTSATYTECQQRYASLRSEYLAHQRTHDDSVRMAAFFDTCVEGNYREVEAILDYIEEQLYDGRSVEITIRGFASPLFTDDYNHTLSARRIASYINMIRAWRNGVFADAIDDGRLRIVQQPMGIDTQYTNARRQDPVYSLSAAQARRIEILSCETK